MTQSGNLMFMAMLAALFACGEAGAEPPSQITYSQVDVSTLKALRTPSLAEQRFYLTGLPEGQASIVMSCVLLSGGWPRCEPKDRAAPAEAVEAARRIAGSYRFDLSPLAGQMTLFTTDMTIALTSPDLDLDLNGATIIPAKEVAWKLRPTGDDAARYYPDRAQRMEQSGDVRLTCRILADLSLACVDAVVAPPGDPEFAFAARRLSLRFQAEPTLKNGAPAAGVWVDLPIAFRLPQ